MAIPWESELIRSYYSGGDTMIGIYKYVNNINGKIYIGQSVNIKRRYCEHLIRKALPIEKAISKYGIENFTFEILEECKKEELDKKEIYYIEKFQSMEKGYNCSIGGGINYGENNGRALITEQEVINIRISYKNHERRKDVYDKYKNLITFNTFAKIWDGSQWSYIMPEVYTKENKEYYATKATNGELSYYAVFKNIEIVEMRERYVNETAKEIYEDYKDRCSYQTLQQILWGRTYKELPIYKKKTKEWINK